MERKAEMIYEDALRKAEKVVLYFHGQVGDRGKSNRVATYKGIQSALPSAHVIAMDCRGYGDSDGFPSEIGFKIDALAAWTWITERVESRKIMIYGHSLGSGIATNLCLQLEDQNETPLALVLDAAFTSMPDMMTAYRKIPIVRPFARFPMLINHFKMRLTDRFETVRAVETIKSPLLLIHGEEDADVLISNSHTLFHTALTARRLQSCTKELAVTEAGEAAFEEDELAREGLELSFQQSGYSTGTTLGSAPGIHSDLVQRNSHRQQQQRQQQQKQKQNSLFMDGERSPTSFGEDSGIGSEVTSGTSRSLEYNQEYQIGFLTVQYAVHNTCMDFDLSRQVLGTFLRTVESRLVAKGLLATVSATSPKWGQSNTAPFMDDTESTAMSRTDSGATRENGLQGKEDAGNSYHSSEWEGEGEGEPAELDLARILCRDKIGYVDQSEVPEVVE
ncbi:Monoacylglycerol lipase abhd12 [Lunasporangiospora selenospora]|uniref:Monoacylglycerol lipase abhd12 n=1 Tax=Lunasporangiospora selenospora TaxID=979761 RepID=A0A9P6FW40_9FUNG|nr:Monoacylglycerol lipase abhd12 [Lunasporangiospora selenospora]